MENNIIKIIEEISAAQYSSYKSKDHPKAFMVVGQPGAGKTQIIKCTIALKTRFVCCIEWCLILLKCHAFVNSNLSKMLYSTHFTVIFLFMCNECRVNPFRDSK